jgi:5-methylcytosine-specific restriction endonuclease McrA
MRSVPERIAAKAAGEKRYSTGKPCKNGHLCERRTCNGRCLECDKGILRRYKDSHPGLEARWARERRAKDPTGHRAEVKRWKERNPQKDAENMRKWKASKDPQYHRDAHKRWREANIEYFRAYSALKMRIRRGLRGRNGGTYTLDDVQAMRDRQHGLCAACQRPEPKLQVDHIVPITKGGTNDPENLQLLCGACNKSKGNKDFTEWAAHNGIKLHEFPC